MGDRAGTEHGGPGATPISRRKWLRGALLGGLSILGAAVGVVRTSGYDTPSAESKRLRVLGGWRYVVTIAAARRIVLADRPSDPSAVSPDEAKVADFADGYLAGLPEDMQRDFCRFLRYLEQLAPLSAGLIHRFSALPGPDQDRVLESLEQSSVDALRAGFEALKGVIMMGYYRDPRTFRMLGYPGPLVVSAGAP
jgi:hypothetical protein